MASMASMGNATTPRQPKVLRRSREVVKARQAEANLKFGIHNSPLCSTRLLCSTCVLSGDAVDGRAVECSPGG